MPLQITSGQVLALAPDAQLAGAAQGLASLHKWRSLGLNEEAAWGECPGSGQQPYQVVARLATLTSRCTCPSRKRPCKHALALLLLAASEPVAFTVTNPPTWASEQLAHLAPRPRAPHKSTVTHSPTEDAGSANATRRAVEREAHVAAGLDELALWIADLVRRGLATAQTQPPRFWEAMAARLVDAQAPGAARLVRALGGLPAAGPRWPEQLAARLGQLHLLIEGYGRREALPPELQAEVRAVLGFTLNHDALLEEAGVRDRWLVLGRRVLAEDQLRVQRVWLWGAASARPALVLSYAAPGQALDARLLPGTAVEAELVFFPGALRLRALFKLAAAAQALDHLPGAGTLAQATAAFGRAATRSPWLEAFPIALGAVTPAQIDGAWWLRDAAGDGWPLAPDYPAAWPLLALSAGGPLPVFGEWDGETFWPLSAWAEGRLALLDGE